MEESENTKRIVIRFLPSDREVEIEKGTDLLTAALENDVPIATQCKGNARCGCCLIEIIEGSNNLNKIGIDERDYLPRKEMRLACRARAYGPVTVRCVQDPEAITKNRSTRLRKDSEFEVGGPDLLDC